MTCLWYLACLIKFRRKREDLTVGPSPLITSHIDMRPSRFRRNIAGIARRGSFVKCHKRCDGDNPCGLSKGHTFPYCICDGAPSNCVCFGSD